MVGYNYGTILFICTASELYDVYKKFCDCAGINTLPQNVVMPRIADHPDVRKKRTGKGVRYEGVGIKKPESLLLLQRMKQKRREDEFLEYALDEYF